MRHIYRRYMELGSVHALCEELERDGIRTKVSTSKAGTTRGNTRRMAEPSPSRTLVDFAKIWQTPGEGSSSAIHRS